MAGFIPDDGLVDTENGYGVINSVNKIIDVIVSGYSDATFVMNPTTGSRYVDISTAATGKVYYKMFVKDVWVPVFELDTTTTPPKIRMTSDIDVTGSAPVQKVNNVVGNVQVTKLFPDEHPSANAAKVEVYNNATYVGTLVEVVKAASTATLGGLPSAIGQIGFDTSTGKFMGRYSTGWGLLSGTQSIASDVTTLSATGFTAANRIVMTNAASSGAVIESGYTIPTTVGVASAGKVLMSDGTNVNFKPIQNIYVTLSGAAPIIDWSAGHVFFHTISTADVTYPAFGGSPVNGQMIMLMVRNTSATNGYLITLPTARWIMGIQIKDIAPNTTTVYTIMMANNEYWVVSTRDMA